MNTYYIIYIKSIIRLAGSMVLKSSRTASLLNNRLSSLGFEVDWDNPYSWKYYLNLAGLYHAVDKEIVVTSLDDLTQIPFTVESLNVHLATKEAYSYGSEFYNALVSKYPRQQTLIKGILNPIPLETSISAADHRILFHDKSLVESNEQYLIPAIQRFTDLYFSNWYNKDYDLFEDRNYPGVLGNYYTKLVMEIIALRKRACKTDNAHSFHVRQYLSSFSEVGKEFEYMTEKQRLWLYRNIRYLNRNIGRKEVFDELVQRFMTDRGFSLVGYDFDHDYAALTEDLIPDVELRRVQINNIPPAMGGKTSTVGTILDKELVLAEGNAAIRDDTETLAVVGSRTSLSARLPTKVLESSVLDKTDSEPYTLTDVLLNHWIYLSNADKYSAVITFVNPGDGKEESLSVKDAFTFFLYAYNRWLGIELEYLPTVSANRVQRIPTPSYDELRQLGSVKKVPDKYITHILGKLPDLNHYVSVAAFKDKCREVQRCMTYLREMRHLNGDYIAEGMLHTIIDRCYMDVRVDLGKGKSYKEWLFEKSIDIDSMGRTEFGIIAKDILKLSTGADTADPKGFKAIHAAMIRIMKALSSYSVQYIAEVNDSPLKVLDSKFPKQTIPTLTLKQDVSVESPHHCQRSLSSETLKNKYSVNLHLGKARVTDEVTTLCLTAGVGVVYKGMAVESAPILLPTPSIRPVEAIVADISDLSDTEVYGYDPIPTEHLAAFVGDIDVVGYNELSESRRKAFLGL